MFKQLILDNQNYIKNINTIKRDYIFYDDLLIINKIVCFVGPRRVGKTFLMIDFIKELIYSNKIDLQQVVFIDFSINSGEIIDPQKLLLSYKELYNNSQPFFIFDEIQDIANFKDFVLYLYNLGYKIFLSGSNSKLLSSELSTYFRGRTFEYKVFPLTFKETLRFKNLEFKNKYSTEELAGINNILNENLKYGSFPEIVLSSNDLFKIDNLKTYLDILIYKDLLERYKIENSVSLKYLIKSITLSNAKIISINKIYNELKSLNIKISKTTLYEYYEYIKNIFYIFELENFFNIKASKKILLFNIGFNKILGNSDNFGQAFENFILLELIKKYDKVFFKKNGGEIDFYIPSEKINVQACYELNNENFKREIDIKSNKSEKNYLVYFENKVNFNFTKIGLNIEIINFLDFIKIFGNKV